jgi:hypothetical protein
MVSLQQHFVVPQPTLRQKCLKKLVPLRSLICKLNIFFFVYISKITFSYGVGTVMYEMLTGDPPYYENDLNMLNLKIL